MYQITAILLITIRLFTSERETYQKSTGLAKQCFCASSPAKNKRRMHVASSRMILTCSLLLLFRCRLLRCRFLRRSGGLGFLAATDQEQSIRSIEWELLNGRLPCSTESDVNSAIARQNDDSLVPQNPLTLFGGYRRVRIDRRLDLCVGQVVLFTKGLGINVVRRNAGLSQVILGSVDTPLRERLIVFNAATWIRMPFEDQMSIRLGLQIFREVLSQLIERMLLAWQQASVRFLFRRLRRREVNAVSQCESRLQFLVYRRWWRIRNRHQRRSVRTQVA